MKNKSSAFTLIELLIVIVIIGILAGVVLAVINPANQIKRSNQTSARGVISKACLAVNSCLASAITQAGAYDYALCDTAAEAGYTFPINTYDGAYSITAATAAPVWTQNAASGVCSMTCDTSLGATTSGRVLQAGAGCLVTQN